MDTEVAFPVRVAPVRAHVSLTVRRVALALELGLGCLDLGAVLAGDIAFLKGCWLGFGYWGGFGDW